MTKLQRLGNKYADKLSVSSRVEVYPGILENVDVPGGSVVYLRLIVHGLKSRKNEHSFYIIFDPRLLNAKLEFNVLWYQLYSSFESFTPKKYDGTPLGWSDVRKSYREYIRRVKHVRTWKLDGKYCKYFAELQK